MKKEGKHITRWKTGATKLQGAAYLREMAEQGWILEDMNHLTYSFREEEPQYLKYRLEELEHAPTGEELAEYERNGWQKVCNYELEYVFVKERDPAEDAEADKEEVVQELDRQIAQEKKNDRLNRYIVVGAVLFGMITGAMMFGLDALDTGFVLLYVKEFAPMLLVAFLAYKLRVRRLTKKKEQVLDGELLEEYTDWRGQRKGLIRSLLLLVVLIGFWAYYSGDKNETLYDLPHEINYAEVPAPRLEKIEGKDLIRVGGDIARQKAARGDHFWHIYDNSVTEEKNLFIKTPCSVEQKMAPVGEAGEITLSTDYCMYAAEILAEREYKKELKEEETSYPGINVSTQTVLDAPRGNFDGLHVCRREYVDETVIHILCRDGKQIMDLTYNGQAEVDDILMEIQKVFLAQK